MKELEGSLSDEEKTKINAAKDELSKALEGTDFEDIKNKTDKLTEEFHVISTKLYEKAQAQGGGEAGFDPNNMAQGMGGQAAPEQDAPKPDNVVDADFEVVDDENK